MPVLTSSDKNIKLGFFNMYCGSGTLNMLIPWAEPTGNFYQRVYFNQAGSIFKRYFIIIFLSQINLRLIIITHNKFFGIFIMQNLSL